MSGPDPIHIIGGGLAGSEAAWQIADAGVPAVIHEMRPHRGTEAHKTDGLAVQAATGDLGAIHDYTIAASETGLATQLTVAMRNKAVEAFQTIMQMPI